MNPDPTQSSPIVEFDPDVTAIIEPRGPKLSEAAPERAVLCFFQDVLKKLLEAGQLLPVGNLFSEIGPNPVYRMELGGQRLLVAHPGVGSALAAAVLDELIACGVKKFIACGGCGVLNRDIAVGHPVILSAAVRDEGASYHYLPPAREVRPSAAAVLALQQASQQAGLPALLGKAWTTDGFYRETAGRRARREAEGCLVVEMEAAAFFAVAEFRKVIFGQVVYGGDLVIPEGWDHRAWQDRSDDRTRMFWLAADAACRL